MSTRIPFSPTGIIISGAAVSSSTLTTVTLSGVTVTDATDIILGSTTGTKIGTATTQKLGFYNKTPVTQQTTIAAVDNSTVDGTYGAEEQAVIGDLRTKFDDLVTKLKAYGLIA